LSTSRLAGRRPIKPSLLFPNAIFKRRPHHCDQRGQGAVPISLYFAITTSCFASLPPISAAFTRNTGQAGRAGDGPTTGATTAAPASRAQESRRKDSYVLSRPKAAAILSASRRPCYSIRPAGSARRRHDLLDGDTLPTINGTGSEDYYNGAWDFGLQSFGYQHNGAPYMVDPEHIGGRYCLYRWHTESPITFDESIR